MTLATCLLAAALPRTLVSSVRRGASLVTLIETPSDTWVTPVTLALNRMFKAKPDLVQPARTLRAIEDRDIRIVNGPVFAIAADAAQLPTELVAGADHRIRLTMTSSAIEGTFRAIYGRSAKVMRADFAGLDWRELMMAFRPDSGPRDCLRRMRATAEKLRSTRSPDHTPQLHELAGVGDLMPKLLELAADIVKVRDGALDAPLPSLLLYGEPGAGKTTIARSLARTVGLPIVETSVGDWFSGQQTHLGTVISNARQFFDRAAATAPCVAFIDECDGLPNRATLDDKNRDWWTPIVTSVLVSIDRMRARDSRVVLVCATNHVGNLDAALIRPGRLDLHIEVKAPASEDDHRAILAFYLKDDLRNADLTPIAQAALAARATPAAIRSWVLRARDTARSQDRPIALADLAAQALPASDLSPQAAMRVALHEAAHAIIARHVGIEVPSLSLVEMGTSLGRAVFSYGEAPLTRQELERHVVAGLAGRAADELFNGGAAANAIKDLLIATRMIASIHTTYGLGEKLASPGAIDKPESLLAHDPALKILVEADLQRLLARSRDLVASCEPTIRALAARLILARVLGPADIDAAIAETAGAEAVFVEDMLAPDGRSA
ncbi:AAA family ATPase [Methylopila sp. M107]|uniref:AAA family ATPase n=1 Tax=Methylopila sp. M107 TaxID=1101190 RepID=UPI001AEBB7F7|nr:AAA family ATPase [Methylopila sp. M107]